jgi:hypothetical protein
MGLPGVHRLSGPSLATLARASLIQPAESLIVDQDRPLSGAEGEEMKRQIAKGLAMLMVTLGLAAASAVVASGQSQKLAAQVPFDFVVADKTLSAGEYRVGAIDQSRDAISIMNTAGDGAIRLSSPTKRGDHMKTAKLVFHRYGSTYFLSQVWMAGEQTGRELSLGKQERAIQRERKAVASNRPVYEVVEVIASAR